MAYNAAMDTADILKKAEAARAAVMEARKERPSDAKSPPGGGKRRGWHVAARRSVNP